MSSYSMKQAIYSGNKLNDLMDELVINRDLEENKIRHTDADINGYKDVIIPLGASLSANALLYVEFDLKIDRVDSTTYKLKLVNQNNYNNYEIVKIFTVAEESDDDMDASLVCLYEVPGQHGTNAAIPVLINDYSTQPANPETYFTNEMGYDAGTLWYYYDNKGEEVYYHYFGNGKSELVEDYNDMIIRHSWIDPSEDSIYHFSGLISSRYSESSFDALMIEIEREHVDEEIIHATDADTKHFYGRLIDIDVLDFKAKIVNKLLPADNEIIKKIGVQGHPGLTMVINGEEIKMGPSGLFELNDFDITSFGVCGDAKRFIVDYQYVTINDEEEGS